MVGWAVGGDSSPSSHRWTGTARIRRFSSTWTDSPCLTGLGATLEQVPRRAIPALPVPGRVPGEVPAPSGPPDPAAGAPSADPRPMGAPRPRSLALVRLVQLLFEGLVGRGLRRQDTVEVLDLVVLVVVLEIVLEIHLLADQRALQIGRASC